MLNQIRRYLDQTRDSLQQGRSPEEVKKLLHLFEVGTFLITSLLAIQLRLSGVSDDEVAKVFYGFCTTVLVGFVGAFQGNDGLNSPNPSFKKRLTFAVSMGLFEATFVQECVRCTHALQAAGNTPSPSPDNL